MKRKASKPASAKHKWTQEDAGHNEIVTFCERCGMERDFTRIEAHEGPCRVTEETKPDCP